MNRWVVAVVTGMLAVGCATGVEDPQPAPEPPPVSKPVPARAFAAEVPDDTGIDPNQVGDELPAVPEMDQQDYEPPMPMPEESAR